VTVPAEPSEVLVGAGPDVDVVDRVVGGRIRPSDVPAAYRGVARLLRALTSAATKDELSREPVAVAMAVVALQRPRVVHHRSRSLLAKGRVAALVVAGTSVAATGAAAANVLPHALERPIAHVLSRVGIAVVSPDDGGRLPIGVSARYPGHRPSVPTARPTAAPPGGGVHAGPALSQAASDGRSHADRHPTHRAHGRPKAAHPHEPPHERPRTGHAFPADSNARGGGPPRRANPHVRASNAGRHAQQGNRPENGPTDRRSAGDEGSARTEVR
jgi:hypothetical protein